MEEAIGTEVIGVVGVGAALRAVVTGHRNEVEILLSPGTPLPDDFMEGAVFGHASEATLGKESGISVQPFLDEEGGGPGMLLGEDFEEGGQAFRKHFRAIVGKRVDEEHGGRLAGDPLGEGGLAEGAAAEAEVEAWVIEGHGEPLGVAAARTADACPVDDGSAVVDNGRARIGGCGGDRGIGTDFDLPALAQ